MKVPALMLDFFSRVVYGLRMRAVTTPALWDFHRKSMPQILSRNAVFSTPWFSITAKTVGSQRDAYYALECLDYVSVCAVTPKGEVLLVEQYRPAVETDTLEFICGHVEAGETPEQAARRELREEAGVEAPAIEQLGVLVSDTGRLTNRLWCFFAEGVVPCQTPAGEEGLTLVSFSVSELLSQAGPDGRLNQAFSLALMYLLCRSGKLGLAMPA
jgi:ADP-ribose pyrophosphatase